MKNGDIISIDIGAFYKGYHGDAAKTHPVGEISENDKLLIDLSKIYLFPLYVVGFFLRFYDILKLKLTEIIKTKILKEEKKNEIEDWWIS